MNILALALLGLCFGSFSNALVWRLHQQLTQTPKALKSSKKGDQTKKHSAQQFSITRGRSMCPNCQHQLSAIDLIPVVSWLALGGKCRYCRRPISWQYPAVELLVAALFVVSYIAWPYGWGAVGWFQFAAWLAVVVGLVALAVYDLRWMILPNRLIYPVGALAVGMTVVLAIWHTNPFYIIGSLAGVLTLAGFFYALWLVSHGRWIGFGDVRLAVIIGILVTGPAKTIMVLVLASLLGTIVAVPSLITKRWTMTQRIPFGPFLILATIIVYLFGGVMITWYKQQFLLQ